MICRNCGNGCRCDEAEWGASPKELAAIKVDRDALAARLADEKSHHRFLLRMMADTTLESDVLAARLAAAERERDAWRAIAEASDCIGAATSMKRDRERADAAEKRAEAWERAADALMGLYDDDECDEEPIRSWWLSHGTTIVGPQEAYRRVRAALALSAPTPPKTKADQ